MTKIDEEQLAKTGYKASWGNFKYNQWDQEYKTFQESCRVFARAVVANLREQGFTIAPSAPYRRVIVDLGMARRCVPTDEDQHDLQTAYEAVSSWIGAMKQEDIVALQRALSAKEEGDAERSDG